MPGQRRFVLFVCVGVVILLFFFRQPNSVNKVPYIGSSTHGSYEQDKAAQEHAASVVPPHVFTTSQAVATSQAAVAQELPTPQIAPLSTSKVVLAQESPIHLSQQSIPTSHATPAASQDASIDPFAYLQESETPDPFAYLGGSTANFAAQQETSAVDEYAYLSASTSIDEYAYLTAASTHTASASAGAAVPSIAASGDPNLPESDGFADDYWFFQDELSDYPLPKFNIDKMKSYTAHNYKGPGHETYATFLSTRNSSLQDPYFLATVQQAYRLLWDTRSKSKHYPFTVFVAPYIPKIQRDVLMASGAIVRELELIAWHPTHPSKAAPRWRDMFSKLNFWNQTDYSRILYLDTDAFPLENIDELFDMADVQNCNTDQLPEQEQLVKHEICEYTLLAAYDQNNGGLNAGMIVMKPNKAMHTYLLRESQNSDNFDQDFVEQAFLNYAFREDGPFPYQLVDRMWNAIFTKPEDEGNIKVIHEKLWAMFFRTDHFAYMYFRDTWNDMVKLYESAEFVELRSADAKGTIKSP